MGGRKPLMQQPFTDGPAKTKLCNKVNTLEGCKFGDKCRFAHSEAEIGGRSMYRAYENSGPQPSPMSYGGGYHGSLEASPPGLVNFGQSATVKISIDASLAGAVIGKGGVNSKQICRVTGVKLAVRDRETDKNQKNIELEGSFDQIIQASAMVRELIVNLGGGRKQHGGVGNNMKTKMCENFAKGQCTFGERCRFAHGANELRV